MMKAKPCHCPADNVNHTIHKQVVRGGGVTNKANGGLRPHNLAKIDLQARAKKVPATGI